MRFCFLFSLFLFSFYHCFSQSAENLNKQSKEFLLKNDFEKAVPLIKEAAELGNAESQYNYGICFQAGQQVTQNDSIANVWFLKSALQGWKDAEFKIAYSYALGRGINHNDGKAFYWSLKCGQQNDVQCMYNVISCYMEGRGTAKNTDSMMVWAIRVASLPNPEDLQVSGQITSARLSLANMYLNGEYVPKDTIKSYAWLLAYNESKRDFSMGEQLKNIDLIKTVEKDLTPDQRKIAILNSEKFLGHSLQNLSKLYKEDI